MDPTIQDMGSALINGGIPNTPNYINPAYATPNQRAQLYAYANELMKPQPVNNWAQGLGEIARSLIGGYVGHQADVQEQASQAQNKADFTNALGAIESPQSSSGGQPPAPQPATAIPAVAPASAGGVPQTGTMPPEVQKALFHASVDSGVPLPVLSAMAGQESSNNPNAPHGGLMQITDATARNPGYGMSGVDPATLQDPTANAEFGAHYLAARSPGTDWNDPQQRAAALTAYNGGGDPNYAAHVMARMPGNGGPAGPAPAPPNGLPVSPGAIGELMGNANISDAQKQMVEAQLAPRLMKDALGNVSPMYQNQPVHGAPAFQGGVAVPFDPLHPTIPGFLGGTPNGPHYSIIPPGSPSAPGVGPQAPGATQGAPPSGSGVAGFMAPGTPVGTLVNAAQTLQAQGGAKAAVAKAQADEYTEATHLAETTRNASYPLHQIQGILEKNGGMLPTGAGANNVINAESVGNLVGTLLGHPLTGEDSQLTGLQLLHKYGTQIAQAQAGSLGLHTNFGLENTTETSPGTELSGPANLHLVDNLVRLNDLTSKYAQAKQDYYQKNGNLNGFQQTWQASIDGASATPLSKFPVATARGSDGQFYDKVPSTDHRGFSWVPHGSIQ